jgi:RNA polymerase sigma factor (sigma-70 family)
MATSVQAVLDQVRAIATLEQADQHLLNRFVTQRDEAAFAAIVQRHGPMVLSVCRRVAGCAQDAEDAFQAAFVVLARKAAEVRKQESLNSWLHGVAFRLASKLRLAELRRHRHERQAGRQRSHATGPETAWRELQEVLDRELQRLPPRYRAVLVLCYLEGQGHEEIARQLGCPLGTVRSRLARARDLLRRRLERHGLPLSAMALAVVFAANTAMALPAALVENVCRAALGRCAAAGTSSVAALAETALAAQTARKAMAVILLVIAVAVGAAGWASYGGREPETAVAPSEEQPPRDDGPRTDAYGDRLPDGAIARLGALRWRHDGEVYARGFSTDGKLFAAGCGRSSGGALFIYDTVTGRVLERLQTSRDNSLGVGSLAFSPAGNYLAYQLSDTTVHLWDIVARKPSHMLASTSIPEPGVEFSRICFSPDGRLLAAPQSDARVVIWEVATGKVVSTLVGHNFSNPRLYFTPDGRSLVMTAWEPLIQRWDVRTSKRLNGFDPDFGADLNRAGGVALAPDGRTIATAAPNRIILSELATGREMVRLEIKGDCYPTELAFTPDQKQLLVAGGGKVHVWDLGKREERFVLDAHGWLIRSMALSADGKTVAVGTVYNVIRLWDLASGKELFSDLEGHDAPVNAVAYSPDGKLLVTGGENGQVRFWDAATGRMLRQLKTSARSISFSPDGRRLVIARPHYKNLRVWDVATARELLALPPKGAREALSAVFSPDGKQVLSVDSDPRAERPTTELQVHDAATGKHLETRELPGDSPECLAVACDGTIAVGGYWLIGQGDAPLVVCPSEGARRGRSLIGHNVDVTSVAFSPDGHVLVSAGDRTVRLWELASCLEVAVVKGSGSTMTAVAVSPNGRLIAAAEGGRRSMFFDGSVPPVIHLWDIATGEELARLDHDGSVVTSLAFSPDGTRLVSGLANGSVLIWDVAAKAKPATLARHLGRADLNALWTALAGRVAGKAHVAIWVLAASPEQAVPFLRKRLSPAEAIDTRMIERWLTELDADAFETREVATRELLRLDSQAAPLLRKALASKPSPEQKRRIERILAGVDVASGDVLRDLRALRVLEMCRSPEARRLLEELARGAPEARLTRQAVAIRKRLEAR